MLCGQCASAGHICLNSTALLALHKNSQPYLNWKYFVQKKKKKTFSCDFFLEIVASPARGGGYTSDKGCDFVKKSSTH